MVNKKIVYWTFDFCDVNIPKYSSPCAKISHEFLTTMPGSSLCVLSVSVHLTSFISNSGSTGITRHVVVATAYLNASGQDVLTGKL